MKYMVGLKNTDTELLECIKENKKISTKCIFHGEIFRMAERVSWKVGDTHHGKCRKCKEVHLQNFRKKALH